AKAEAEELQRNLDALSQTVADLEHDLAVFQTNIADLVATQAGNILAAPKRSGEIPVGLKLMKEALDTPNAALVSPKYLLYKAACETNGGSALCPLHWRLYQVLGPLDEDSAGQ
ncbi:MAG: hypothetical protein ACKPKO_63210, partial [Candidatus Fonsibacter sp.]